MATLIYLTDFESEAPWLMTSVDLLELDAILSKEWERLAEHESNYIRRLTSEFNFEYAEHRAKSLSERSVVLTLPGSKKLAATSIKEASLQHELMTAAADSLDISLARGEVRLEMSIKREGFHNVTLKVRPEGLEDGRELFAAVYTWLRRLEPPKWQAYWLSLRSLVSILWGIYIAICVQIVSSGVYGTSTNTLKDEAHALLKQHVTAANRDRAIELLLALQSDYIVMTKPEGIGIRSGLFIVCGLVGCLIASFPPRTSIGLGHGDLSVRRQRWWIRFVSVTIPMLIFSNIILPPLRTLILSVWKP